MRHRAVVSMLAVFFLLLAFPATAQRIRAGRLGGPAAKAVAPNASSYTVSFPDTPVNGRATEACYYYCYFLDTPDNCDGSGTVTLTKAAGAPFSVVNYRKALASTQSCDGTPVSLPVTLQPGELLLQDFVFSPKSPGTFQDTHIYDGSFTWLLVGATPVSAPKIVSFAATPSTIRPGQSATISWVVQGATSVLIDNGIGAVGASGSAGVSPSTTTTYTLTAMSGNVSSTATATVTVISAPTIVISAFPAAMLQQQGVGGGTTSYALTNAGGASSAITLTQTGTFFTQSPSTFTLAPGTTQVVTVTGASQSAGVFEGASIPSGSGVAGGLQIPIKLLSVAPPSGSVIAKPAVNRVDVAAPSSSSPSGSVSFTNSGTSDLTGVLSSDAPWLIPQSGVVTIPAGSTRSFSFTIDRSKRTDADALVGSALGNLSLSYLSGASGKVGALDTTSPSVSLVTVVDSVQLTVSNAGPPPLSTGEVALFVPGAGHVTGPAGTFLSDLSVLNPPGNPAINDLRFFFTPTAAGVPQKQASLPPVGGVSVAMADVVKNVFNGDGQVGSLQIRSASADKLSINATIFNVSKPQGTYGTIIPTFRSDRAVGSGESLVLTGLRQDATGYTNLFLQETSGTATATVTTEFLGANGNTLGTRSDDIGPFALKQVNGQVPTGAVAAVMTNASSGTARFLAYATPVDVASGDNWSLVDWSRQFGYQGNAAVVVPVAGVLQGANNTFFRTDLAITNTSTSAGSGTLRFYPRGGTPSDKAISLGGRQTTILSNVIGSTFNAPSGSIGYLLFTPAAGSFVITSRTYTTVAGQVATFGTGVPTLPVSGALSSGALRAIGSLEDSTVATIVAGRPATFRTNFGLLETSGNGVTVRVTLRFNYPAGTKVQAIGSASKDYTLSSNEFRQLNGIAGEILGASRATLGDLRGMEADFQVVGGSGAVMLFTSSTDNGTGDAILRTE